MRQHDFDKVLAQSANNSHSINVKCSPASRLGLPSLNSLFHFAFDLALAETQRLELLLSLDEVEEIAGCLLVLEPFWIAVKVQVLELIDS